MPRKKLSDCSEHVKLMRVLKAKLIEISMKVENYIYKQKPITKMQAKAFLNEISAFKPNCQNDVRYIQVIEKLTKYMNIIISNNTDKNPIKEINSSHENMNTSKKTTLTSTNDNFSTTADVVSKDINQDPKITHNATNNQNNLGFTQHNQSTSGTEVTSREKNIESDNKCYNTIEEKSDVNEAVDLEKVSDISSKAFEIGSHIECYNETNLPQCGNNKKQGEFKDDNKTTTNKVQSSLRNDYHLLICVDRGVIKEIKHVSNATVIHQAPELTIPLNAFVLNNTKMPNTLSGTHPKVMENNLNIKSSEEPKIIPVINKSDTKKINNNIVKFTAPYNDVANISIDHKKSNEENNTEKEFLSTPTFGIKKAKKQRTSKKDITKNKKDNIKDSQGKNNKKSKSPTTKTKANKRKNCTNNLAKEVKSSNNELNKKAQGDLSWFDSIKYVRKIDEQEYFKPPQSLDDSFWNNPSLLPYDDREFNM